MKTPSNPGLRTYVNLKKDNWDRYRQEVEAALSKHSLPTDCQRYEKIFHTVLLKAALHQSLLSTNISSLLQDQHSFRSEYSTTLALLQLTTDINERKSPNRTVCVTIELLVVFDTVCHNNLLSKINRSQLPLPTT